MSDEEKIRETCKGLEFLLNELVSYRCETYDDIIEYWINSRKINGQVCITPQFRRDETILDYIFFVLSFEDLRHASK